MICKRLVVGSLAGSLILLAMGPTLVRAEQERSATTLGPILLVPGGPSAYDGSPKPSATNTTPRGSDSSDSTSNAPPATGTTSANPTSAATASETTPAATSTPSGDDEPRVARDDSQQPGQRVGKLRIVQPKEPSDAPNPAQSPASVAKQGEPTKDRAAEVDDSVAPRPVDDSPSDPILPEDRPAIEITPELADLRDRIRMCLAIYFQRPENVASRSPWGIMHSMLPYGVDGELLANGERVNAIGWLCWNGSCRGQRLLYIQRDQLAARVGAGYQGHEGQLLAMLAQSRVKPDYPVKVDGRMFTVRDLIEYEQKTCQDGTELTFKLISLSHYLDSEATWKNQYGQTWDIPRLIREELKQPVIGAACGGTHRMMGFAYSVTMRERSGRPVDGQWLRAQLYVRDYQDYAFKLQNRDGSFSTRWFEGREAQNDVQRRLQTTGHILEWLVFSLPQEELTRPEVVRSVEYVVGLMLNSPQRDWEVGPRGHALRSLALYDQRVFGGSLGNRSDEFARLLRQGRAAR